MRIYAFKNVRSIDRTTYERCLSRMDDKKRQRVLAVRDPMVLRNTLLSDQLTRLIVRRELGLGDSEITFFADPFGKPSVVGMPNVHFNLSHAGEWIVVAFDDRPVGIDIEREISDKGSRFPDIFSVAERKLYDRLAPDEQSAFFLTVWTGKESYVKAIGLGMSLSFDAISLLPALSGGGSRVKEAGNGRVWFVRWYTIDQGYSLAICGSREDFHEQVIRLDDQDVLEGI